MAVTIDQSFPARARVLVVAPPGRRAADTEGSALLTESLSGLPGLELQHADSFEEAAQRLEHGGVDVLLLSDAEVGSGALATVRRLSRLAADLPLLVWAGEADRNRRISFVRAGAQEVLTGSRPDSDDLAEALALAWNRKAWQRDLAPSQLYEPSTGLPTRTLLFDRWALAAIRARQAGTWIAVIDVDIDDFDRISQLLRKRGGEEPLVRQVAQRIATALRATDTVARLDRHELLILLEDTTSLEDAEHCVEKIQRAISERFLIGDEPLFLQVSIGVAFARGQETRDLEDLLRRSQLAKLRHRAQRGLDQPKRPPNAWG